MVTTVDLSLSPGKGEKALILPLANWLLNPDPSSLDILGESIVTPGLCLTAPACSESD